MNKVKEYDEQKLDFSLNKVLAYKRICLKQWRDISKELIEFNIGEVYNISYSEMLQKPQQEGALFSLLAWTKTFIRSFQLNNLKFKDWNVAWFSDNWRPDWKIRWRREYIKGRDH